MSTGSAAGRVRPPHPVTPYHPLIVNAALTGMVPRRAKVPHVPIEPGEIVEDSSACAASGASILHLHARDPLGEPEWRRESYERFLPEIRERHPELVLCVTTSGRTFPDLEQRADVLELTGDAKPDMASLTLGSLNLRREASVNAPDTILRLAERMGRAGIKPELEVFDSGMAQLAWELLERGLVEPPLYANILLGGPNTAPARVQDLAHLVDSLPDGTVWAAGGFGAFQLAVNGMAVFVGGHVRTGLEDNPWLEFPRRTPATNPQLVERMTRLADLAGREVASPVQARKALGLPAVPAPA